MVTGEVPKHEVLANGYSESPSDASSLRKPPFAGFGIICSVMVGVVLSFNALLVKLIESNGALQLLASRCAVQFLFLLPLVTYNWHCKADDPFGPHGMFKFLILRGLLGSAAATCLYQSVQIISLGDAVTLQFSNVIFAGFLGHLLLNDSFTAFDIIMSLFAMAGIVLIAQPSFIFGNFDGAKQNTIGVIYGVASGVLNGFTFIVIRKIGRATSASLNVLYYSLSGVTSSIFLAMITGSFSFPCSYELVYIFLLGITGLSAQVLMTLALRFERANTFAVLRAFQIVFVFILQVSLLYV